MSVFALPSLLNHRPPLVPPQVKKHVRSQGDQKGGIFSREAPLHVSNVALLDPKDKCVGAARPVSVGGCLGMADRVRLRVCACTECQRA